MSRQREVLRSIVSCALFTMRVWLLELLVWVAVCALFMMGFCCLRQWTLADDHHYNFATINHEIAEEQAAQK